MASLSVVPPELQRACEIVRAEAGATVAVVEPAWRPFAAACGVRVGDETVGRRFFVGPDFAWLRDELAARGESALLDEFACAVPAAILGRNTEYEDPTLQLWQNGYTPVTVHRVPVDTGVGVVEVVAATVRPTPPLNR